MALLKKFTFNNSVFARVVLVFIILLSITLIGYMLGKFAWYVSN